MATIGTLSPWPMYELPRFFGLAFDAFQAACEGAWTRIEGKNTSFLLFCLEPSAPSRTEEKSFFGTP
jgi:hypothetical protein